MKILVIGPSWVGDMVMAQSLFITLKQNFPGCHIDVLAPEWSLPMLERMPQIAEGISMPLQHGQFGFFERFKIGRQLRSARYDWAIILPNSWKSALIPFFAKIPKRSGYLGEFRWGLLNDTRALDKKKLKTMVQRFAALGQLKKSQQLLNYSFPLLLLNPSGQKSVIDKFNLTVKGKILVLCPGAEYGSSKRWPAEYFGEIAIAKIQQGWQVWLLGSDKDKDLVETINQHTQNKSRDFIGQTSLKEAIDLLSFADLVVANDSGLMHLAAALDKKVIAIYGSTQPEFAPPLCEKAKVVSLDLPCSPCRKRVCPLVPVEHTDHKRCLTGIKPERILELIDL